MQTSDLTINTPARGNLICNRPSPAEGAASQSLRVMGKCRRVLQHKGVTFCTSGVSDFRRRRDFTSDISMRPGDRCDAFFFFLLDVCI
ncbi:hypothetical protein FKM82_028972 [Ascaphus truei]